MAQIFQFPTSRTMDLRLAVAAGEGRRAAGLAAAGREARLERHQRGWGRAAVPDL